MYDIYVKFASLIRDSLSPGSGPRCTCIYEARFMLPLIQPEDLVSQENGEAFDCLGGAHHTEKTLIRSGFGW